MNNVKPGGAEVNYCAQWYKFGTHGRLFVWHDDEWCLSMVEKHLIKLAMRQTKFERTQRKYRVSSDQQKVDMIFIEKDN